jgi:hypothetical protein
MLEHPMKQRRSRSLQYTAGEIGRVRVIEDFLPAPADLVPREENVKVTLSLSRRSLDFFKREAKKGAGCSPRGLDIAKPRCHVIARSERGAAPWRRVMQHDHDFDDLLCFRGHA